MTKEELQEKAKNIARELVWRLELLHNRSQFNPKTGEFKKLPTRIRRFCNALPQDITAMVLEELVRMAPYSGAVFNREEIDETLRYSPTSTYIKRDESLEVGGRRKDHTYTIVQDLVLVDEDGDIVAGVESSSCSRVVNATRHWDEPDLPDCTAGSQGHSFQITDVTRDKETDLFSYTLKEVVAITQHSAPQVTECTEAFTRTVETWDNVYGEPGAFVFDDIEHEAEDLVITPCSADSGENIQAEVQQNDDCTYKIRLVRTISKLSTDAEYQVYKDQYVIRASELTRGSRSPLSKDGVEYSGGVKTTYKSRKNDDGTFDNEVTQETERPVSGSVVETRKTLRGIMVTRLNRNQSSAASTSGLKIGGSVRNERTEGGLYHQTITQVSAESVGKIRESCARTIFGHEHSTIENTATSPSSCEVPNSAGGVTHQRQISVTEEGTYDVTNTEKIELPVSDAVVETRRTIRGVVIISTHRNQASAATVSGLKVGESVRNEVTEGGLYNQVIHRLSAQSVGKISSSCERTIFEHRHSVASNEASSVFDDDVSAASGGVILRKSVRLTEEGTYDVTTEKVTELGVSSSVVEVRRTLRGEIRTVTNRNQSSAASVDNLVIGQTVRNEKTPGGLYTQTIVMPTVNPGGAIKSTCRADAFEHERSTTSNVASATVGREVSFEPGAVKSTRVEATEEGTFDVTDTTVTEKSVATASEEARVTIHGVVKTVQHKSMSSVAILPTSLEIGKTVKNDMTPAGRITQSITESTPAEYRTWKAEFSLSHLYQHTTWFENATLADVGNLVSTVNNLAKSKYNSWNIGMDHHRPSSFSITPHITHNEFGRYDGSITIQAVWGSGQVGQTGTVGAIFSSHSAHTTETEKYIDKETGEIKRRNRTHHQYQVCGRGISKLNSVMSSSLPKLGTVHDSFSLHPADLTWTFSRSETTNWSDS